MAEINHKERIVKVKIITMVTTIHSTMVKEP
jgi:hypothetical protein